MVNKIIVYIIALIVLALAGEGGYILGINAGKRIGAQETLKNQNQQVIKEKTLSQLSLTIPIADKKAIQWLEQINNFPSGVLQRSEWTVSLAGKFISMDDNSVTLDINGSSKQLLFPIPITDIEIVKFSQYDQTEKKYSPNSISLMGFKKDDDVSVNISVETITGKTKYLEVVKQITQKQRAN